MLSRKQINRLAKKAYNLGKEAQKSGIDYYTPWQDTALSALISPVLWVNVHMIRHWQRGHSAVYMRAWNSRKRT